MRLSSFRSTVCGGCAAVSLLAGCGGLQSPVAIQPVTQASVQLDARHHYVSLYSFKGSPDGAEPLAGLTALAGFFYGATSSGGGYHGPGTIFRITKRGKEQVIFSFSYGNENGYGPASGLVALRGLLYGVALGGNPGAGVVFNLTTSGSESTIYDFKGIPDGRNPSGNLIAVHGRLYGVTEEGGTGRCFAGTELIGCGIIFEITTAGKERVLYSFKGGTDGEEPAGGLIALNGTLYGTTIEGGAAGPCPYGGCGTIFSVSTSGKERVLYRFKGAPLDAEFPYGLTAFNGGFYGTAGGGSHGLGTVFSSTLSGAENVIYNFAGGTDGANPAAPPEIVNGLLYGTTEKGGYDKRYCSGGCGTVFKLSTSGLEEVLHRFKGYPADGDDPIGTLTLLDGRLYGTAYAGGSSDNGTVFGISP